MCAKGFVSCVRNCSLLFYKWFFCAWVFFLISKFSVEKWCGFFSAGDFGSALSGIEKVNLFVWLSKIASFLDDGG